MENETKKSKLTAKDILAKTGPGIIMAAAAVGSGNHLGNPRCAL